VVHVTETFDLTITHRAFEFVFWLYNFVEVADEDNRTLRDPLQRVIKLHSEVGGMSIPTLTGLLKRKAPDNDDAGNEKPKKRLKGQAPRNNDILSDVAIMEALKCAGYTIPPEDEEFTPLLPASVSFP
jgi:hypothetical protein